jgi:hypothetical protein
MGKKPFTTRIDEDVLALAQQLADTERRSVTSLIEVAILDYAARRKASTQSQGVTQLDATVLEGPKNKLRRSNKARGLKPSQDGPTRGKPRSR